MLYLLDANVPITAARDYYPLDQIPEFWDWLLNEADNGTIKMPFEILDEVFQGKRPNNKSKSRDLLLEWLSSGGSDKLMLGETLNQSLVQKVTDFGYAADLNDQELEEVGRDPLIIAYALVDLGQRTVVTTEVSKPKRVRQNRHLPDVCGSFSVPWCNTFQMNKALGFRTGWRE